MIQGFKMSSGAFDDLCAQYSGSEVFRFCTVRFEMEVTLSLHSEYLSIGV